MDKSLIILDLYNTIIVDDHIEEQHQYRINSIWSAIEKAGFPTRFSDVIKAYEETQAIMKAHQKDHFSLSVFELVNIFAEKLRLTDIAFLKKFYDHWAFASLQYPPKLIFHVKEGLEELKNNNKKIALISNTAMTPGVALRFLLKEQGIYHLFDDMIFSDEFGFMKPQNMIFYRILERLKVPAKETCFIGDHAFYDEFGATSVGIEYEYMCPDTDFRKIVEKLLI
ncbi:MAG: HAD family hydrolase [Brevinema sp.]